MIFTVIWKLLAEEQLAAIWMDTEDRQAVTRAANAIDRLLREDPQTAGESRSGLTRVLVVDPLVVHFDVSADDRMVHVLTVRHVPLPRQD
jgi:plasmid stabilization system protein ParE